MGKGFSKDDGFLRHGDFNISFGIMLIAVLLYTTATLTWSPTSLFELSAVIDVSRASFVFRKSHLRISIMTVASTIVLKLMTSSFVTLLTPTPMMLSHHVSGQQIDLSTAEFGKMLHDEIGWDDEEGPNPKVRTLSGYITVSSGMSAAFTHIGYPRDFTLNRATYSIPTGGILAAGPMRSVNHDLRKDGHLVGDDTAVEMKKLYCVDGIADDTVFSTSINYTTYQMGLRGGVSCKAIGSSGLASSCASIQLNLFKHWKSPLPRNQSFSDWVWSGACPNGTQIDVPTTTSRYIPGLRNKTTEIMGQAFAHVCFDQDLTGAKSTGNHVCSSVLILAGNGSYYGFLRPTVCEIQPTIGTYQVLYNYSSVTINQTSFNATHKMSENTQVLSKYLAMLTKAIVSSSQTMWANTFADDISSVSDNAPEGPEEDKLDTILDDYFNGVIEFATTVSHIPSKMAWRDVFLKALKSKNNILIVNVPQKFFRAHFSTDNRAPDRNHLPNNISREFNGTWIISTMGWDAKSRIFGPTFLSMVPIILVPFFLICAVLVGSYKRLISLPLHLNEPIQFDPNDMTQIIRVACAGNLSEKFSQMSVNQVGKSCTEKDYDKVCVQLNYDDDAHGKLIWMEPQRV
ncbi:uncharacterized protein MELLADRAFT_84888 [Melampsora larici-populina 98AG31]|uniref:Uncharacterized protein n=1 Tax=Melampsora larici-populina (strain 98AG31 / pathotype 3-4-7) TaxID=747676 RepID=F4RH47_MELLP|nr:uncharacterized protein MELLADRAFT_84888 [Melampsora larici-populina 98AG31]EGG08396.1 hypothetical protein MELLADRAFT_84888 [Melampsora larici-populina 98AG31]